ncbi:hypothetical protein BGZ61DRAFT_466794 [Ilyonectria robusta]|uniref:uncharacterized protein n=1 Tax=Ilyonectria robusta TaxID=1079257 RepID=UPI001E8EB150|nr:uncharacterized protein BGZ61DRAFT_469858 [Ilyonectria robusta]XP_046094872.1 uncharacterized protein BGZ61DRAFT_466794 [Ilyonectria robusta]KAH8647538.1 hypothetical protein BGZ61DRAFT_469858 [Ilyonectria robusta]KAH8656414.1 hypothetical protein BGZ61DRAFT_466794 [Ilyonectria robusta]
MVANLKLIKRGVGLWDAGKSELMHDPKARPELSDVFGLDFTRFPRSARIGIPTVHIYGSRDPRWPAGIQLANSVTTDWSTTMEAAMISHGLPRCRTRLQI